MSIVVAHSPDLAVTSELAYQSGKGQYNQWLAQFKQQQENAKTQAILGGFGAGSRLGLGIAGMRQQERMQGQRLAAGTQKAAAQLEDDQQWSQIHGQDLFDAAADRWPTQPGMWKKVQGWSRKDQEGLLKWSNGVRSQTAVAALKKSPVALSTQAGSLAADREALNAGKDAGTEQRQKINHLLKTGQINQEEYQKFNRRLDRNLRTFGNQPMRPQTAQEGLEGAWAERPTPDGGTIGGVWNRRTQTFTPHTEALSPAAQKDAHFKQIVAGTTSLREINSAKSGIAESLKGYEDPDDPEKMIMPTEEERADLLRQRDEWDKLAAVLRERMLRTPMGGDTSKLPLMTQNWIFRLEGNPNFESDGQRDWAITLQKLNPDKYILDLPNTMHLRMGSGPPDQRWDNGSADRVFGGFGELTGQGETIFGQPVPEWVRQGQLQQERGTRPTTPPEQAMRADELEYPPEPPMPRDIAPDPMDPPAPPMPRDIAPGGPRPWRPPMQRPSPPALPQGGPTTQAEVDELLDIANRLKEEAKRPKTAAQRTSEGLDIIPRLERGGMQESQSDFEAKRRLYSRSAGARRVAVQQAQKEHVVVGEGTRVTRRPPSGGGLRDIRGGAEGGRGSVGDVQAVTQRPPKLSSAGAKYEVELERLYNAFDRVDDRQSVRYVQSMLRKYGYSQDNIRSQASPREQAAWHEAMVRVKQLLAARSKRK